MIVTLRNYAGYEMDLDFSGPRSDPPPVCLLYDGRLFWRHPEKPAFYNEDRVDDVSRYTILAKRSPPGGEEPAKAAPDPVLHSPSTDDGEPLEID
jgi:hypothetical protein